MDRQNCHGPCWGQLQSTQGVNRSKRGYWPKKLPGAGREDELQHTGHVRKLSLPSQLHHRWLCLLSKHMGCQTPPHLFHFHRNHLISLMQQVGVVRISSVADTGNTGMNETWGSGRPSMGMSLQPSKEDKSR